MPKFLAGWQYNEEEISQHLKSKKNKILASANEWQQDCNRSNRGKTGRNCEGEDFSWLSSKVSRTCLTHVAQSTNLWQLHGPQSSSARAQFNTKLKSVSQFSCDFWAAPHMMHPNSCRK
jgi:metal-dependent amidase/aminoacylase/carboxypeptidase family protein